MKTTFNLPDELFHDIALRAVTEGRLLDDVIADMLRAGLPASQKTCHQNKPLLSKNLPVIKLRPIHSVELNELSTQEWCDWLKEQELQQEVEQYEKAFGHQHVDRVDG